ncbi:hypothetical protein DID76_03780 [Candidatus Marinamargulisbacteria bacterium SCGC AG-414-C22]|nr:hypothetical protein DID76_03780 [Candidatus Marinamargulisbacteria bacterium SCGC AG-414-C22]
MPILGGNKKHKWAFKGDINKSKLDKTRKNYILHNDIAAQILHQDLKKKKLLKKNKKTSFMSKFLQLFSKEKTKI